MWAAWFKVCLLFTVLCPANIIGLWWAKGESLFMDPNKICKKGRKMGGKKGEICRTEFPIVKQMAHGVEAAIHECQNQFGTRRWNCPSRGRSLNKVLRLGTREAAFVNAITSAGVVFKVTQACTMGLLVQCACAKQRNALHANQEWQWGGCDDDVKFGYTKSKHFMDRRKKRKKRKSDIHTKLHLHNNEAGRLAVKNNMERECKCHGLSGSCATKTCWRKMPIFHKVGRILKDRFDGATKVTINNDGAKLIPYDGPSIKEFTKSDLVYFAESPNYCIRNGKNGSQGTMGRQCLPESAGVGGCELLCCGRGFNSQEKLEQENCRCVFKWCCEVTCQTCSRYKTYHMCN